MLPQGDTARKGLRLEKLRKSKATFTPPPLRDKKKVSGYCIILVTKMDTYEQQNQLPKLIAGVLNISIIMGLLFSQHIFEGPPIFASEQLRIANNAIVAPIINPAELQKNIVDKLTIEQRTEKFNEKIKKKYRTGIITDVDTGVKHIKLVRYYQGKPIRINVIEANTSLNPDLALTPAIASDTLGRKSTITTIAKKNNSIVAINGTFFKQQTGVPLGTLMINKKLYTGPIYDRVAMGIFDDGYDMARIQLNASLKAGHKEIKVDNINQPRMLSTYVIAYTPEWGKTAPASPKYGKQIAIKDNKIVDISDGALAIPQDGFVIVGPANQLNQFIGENNIKLDISTIPDWKNVNHIISGGPYLVKNGQAYVDIKEQKLGSIGGRNPRTAVGYTADNDLIIVTVDGREKASAGMSLWELAAFMKSIGCVNAMNLDGGGSTVLYVNGKIANHPQYKGGIALSNALTLNKINQQEVCNITDK